jgi:YegS/Rv2252/BmrU family lipid kinase
VFEEPCAGYADFGVSSPKRSKEALAGGEMLGGTHARGKQEAGRGNLTCSAGSQSWPTLSIRPFSLTGGSPLLAASRAVSRLVLFLNQSSGFSSKEDAAERLRTLLRDYSLEADIRFVQAGVDLAALTREVVREGWADAVVAGGGDGTIRAVAAGLAHSTVALGILPVGTLNHFARDLGIPIDVHQAAEVLVTGRVAQVDLAQVNGWYFINNSILGLYPRYRFQKDYLAERSGGYSWWGALGAWYTVLRRFPFFTLRFQTGDQELIKRTPLVLVANNEHALDGYRLGRRRTLSEGNLYLYVMHCSGRADLVRMLSRMATGTLERHRDFEMYRAKELAIAARQKRMGVALDGEIVLLETPLHYRILPRALRVIIPVTSQAAEFPAKES